METVNATLTLTDLENTFNQAIGLGVNYIGVRIQYPNMKEAIVTIYSNADFRNAIESYKMICNNNLTYVTCKEIKIIGCEYGDSFNEIADWLID